MSTSLDFVFAVVFAIAVALFTSAIAPTRGETVLASGVSLVTMGGGVVFIVDER